MFVRKTYLPLHDHWQDPPSTLLWCTVPHIPFVSDIPRLRNYLPVPIFAPKTNKKFSLTVYPIYRYYLRKPMWVPIVKKNMDHTVNAFGGYFSNSGTIIGECIVDLFCNSFKRSTRISNFCMNLSIYLYARMFPFSTTSVIHSSFYFLINIKYISTHKAYVHLIV